jgi:hypothetical protein
MDTFLSIFIGFGVIALVLAYLINNRTSRNKENRVLGDIPPIVKPQAVDGVMIGTYYGDLEKKVCVDVLSVENGIVAFRYIDPDHRNQEFSMPVQGFLETHFKFPNGCDL